MMTRICKKCNKEKNLNLFNVTNNGNYRTECKKCQADYHKKYREKHKEKLKEYHKKYSTNNAEKHTNRIKQWRKENVEKFKKSSSEYYYNNREYQLEQSRKNYLNNKERDKERTRDWKKNNPEKVLATSAKRRAMKHKAVPGWVEWDDINVLYAKCRHLSKNEKIAYQVDHIIPLKSKKVCGLHCIANLQILTATENNNKKCKFQIDW